MMSLAILNRSGNPASLPILQSVGGKSQSWGVQLTMKCPIPTRSRNNYLIHHWGPFQFSQSSASKSIHMQTYREVDVGDLDVVDVLKGFPKKGCVIRRFDGENVAVANERMADGR
jgi:hypothetical protein